MIVITNYRGVEELVADSHREQSSYSFSIGIPVLLGFVFMFLLEEYATPHGHPPAHSSTSQPGRVAFDIDLEEHVPNPESPPLRHPETSSVQRAYPISLGLITHALIDGYALGVSASNTHSPNLSLIVFLAIVVHKGTSLYFRCSFS